MIIVRSHEGIWGRWCSFPLGVDTFRTASRTWGRVDDRACWRRSTITPGERIDPGTTSRSESGDEEDGCYLGVSDGTIRNISGTEVTVTKGFCSTEVVGADAAWSASEPEFL